MYEMVNVYSPSSIFWNLNSPLIFDVVPSNIFELSFLASTRLAPINDSPVLLSNTIPEIKLLSCDSIFLKDVVFWFWLTSSKSCKSVLISFAFSSLLKDAFDLLVQLVSCRETSVLK